MLQSGAMPTESFANLGVLAFVDQRRRCVESASASFAAEKAASKETFDPDVLMHRFFVTINVAEMASLLSTWPEGESGAAHLLVAASALRSALYLWLEDDHRAMAAARTVLETTAMARAWRIKPNRAMRAAARGSQASARDWLEASGWKRLGIFVRSLGELSHATLKSRWSGAIRILIDIQPDDPTNASPNRTARGSALELVTILLATEVIARLDALNPGLAACFQELISLDSAPEGLEDVLNRIHEKHDLDLGEPDFVVPQKN
jgi:hypothetical protein